MKGSSAPITNRGRGRRPWMLDLRYLGGKREFFTSEALAKAARKAKLDEHKNHGASALSLSHADRVAFTLARDRLSKINLTIEQAVEFCEKHFVTLSEKKLIDAMEELYELKLSTNKKERSAVNFKYSISSLLRKVGDKPLSEITQAEIEGWLYGNSWGPATIRTKRIDVQSFFRAALKRGWLISDPSAGIDTVELDDKPPGILTVDQCERLLRAAAQVDPKFCGWIALALLCGIRPEELAGMQRSDVQIDRGYVEVRAQVSKTRKRRLVDLSDNCKAWLRLGLELPAKNTRGRLNNVRIAAGFRGYRKRLQQGKERWIKIDGESWPHDCLRHSYASYHLAMHQSADLTALQMGHRSTTMLFSHYRELIERADAVRFWAIMP